MAQVINFSSLSKKEFSESHKDDFVVIVFDAEFSGQQDLVEEAVKAISAASELKDKIVLGTVDVEKNDELSKEFSVLSVPMIACIVKGQAVRKVDSLEPAKLVNTILEEHKKYTLLGGELVDQKGDPKEKFNEYLKRLVNRAPVMIFMKGDPRTPRCGFSRQLIELLSKYDLKYETFDILQDDEVRQGLKEYSDWPTYPQIYAKGEFVGGLDILKQLEETKELEATLRV